MNKLSLKIKLALALGALVVILLVVVTIAYRRWSLASTRRRIPLREKLRKKSWRLP